MVILALVVAGCLCSCASSQKSNGGMTEDPPAPSAETETERLPETTSGKREEEKAEKRKSAGHLVLWYIPNRVLDVFDPFRARVRLGPGFSLGARATTYADFYLGQYMSVYAGLPGPRGRKTPRLPVGLESYQGAKVSFLDATGSGGPGPNYGRMEIGADLHLILIGAAVGVDPWEVVDFATGILFIDPMKDDI